MAESRPVLPIEIVDRIVEHALAPVRTLGIDNMALLGDRFPCPDSDDPSPLPAIALTNRRLYNMALPRLWRRAGLSLGPYAAEKLLFLSRRPHLYAHTTSLFVHLASGDDDEDEDDDNYNDEEEEDDNDKEEEEYEHKTDSHENESINSSLTNNEEPHRSRSPTLTLSTSFSTHMHSPQYNDAECDSQVSDFINNGPKRRKIRYPISHKNVASELPDPSQPLLPQTSSDAAAAIISQMQLFQDANAVESDDDISSDDQCFKTVCNKLVSLIFHMPKLRVLALDLYNLAVPLPPPLLLALLVRPLHALYLHEFLGHAFHSLARPLPRSHLQHATAFPPFTPSNLTVLQLACSTAAERLVPHFPRLKALMIRDNFPESPPNVFARWPWDSLEELVLLAATQDMLDAVMNGFQTYRRQNSQNSPIPLKQLVLGGRIGRSSCKIDSENENLNLSLDCLTKTFGWQPLELLGLHKFPNLGDTQSLAKLHRFAPHIFELAITCSPMTLQEPTFLAFLLPFQSLKTLIIDSAQSCAENYIAEHEEYVKSLINLIPSLEKITIKFDTISEAIKVSINQSDQRETVIRWSVLEEFDEWTHGLTHTWYEVPPWA